MGMEPNLSEAQPFKAVEPEGKTVQPAAGIKNTTYSKELWAGREAMGIETKAGSSAKTGKATPVT